MNDDIEFLRPQHRLRFLLYDAPDRRSFKQLGEDIWIDDMSTDPYEYGKKLQLAFAEDGMVPRWYVVATLPHLKMVPNPSEHGSYTGLLQIFLARAEEWDQFDEPEVLLDIRLREELRELGLRNDSL